MIIGVLLFLFAASLPLVDVTRSLIGAGSATELLLVCLVLAWLVTLPRSTFRLTPGLLLLFLVLIVAIWSWWIAQARQPVGAGWVSGLRIAREVEYFGAALVISQLCRARDAMMALVGGLCSGLLIALAFVAAQWVLGPDASTFFAWGPAWAGLYTIHDFRVWGSFGHPLNLVNYLAAFLGICTALVRRDIGARRVVWLGLVICVVLALILTGSRTVLLVVPIPLIYGLTSRSARGLWWAVGSVTLLLVPILATNLATVAIDRLADLGSSDPSVTQRVLVFESALKVMINHPILGVGPGQFAAAYVDAYMDPRASLDPSTFTPENIFLLTGAELGLAGLLLFVSALIVIVARGWGSSAEHGQRGVLGEAVSLGVACLVMSSMTQESSDAASRLLLYTLLGVLLALADARTVRGTNLRWRSTLQMTEPGARR